MSHFVDVLGADYEPDGRMRRWWTADDAAGFEAAAAPIVRQFSEYEPLPGLRLEPVWELEHFDPARWVVVETLNQTFPSHSPFGMNGRALVVRIGRTF